MRLHIEQVIVYCCTSFAIPGQEQYHRISSRVLLNPKCPAKGLSWSRLSTSARASPTPGTYILLSWHKILSRLLCHLFMWLQPLGHLFAAVLALWVLKGSAQAFRVWVFEGSIRASSPSVPEASASDPSPLGVLGACCAPLSPSGSSLLLRKLLPVTSRQLSSWASPTVSGVRGRVLCTLTRPCRWDPNVSSAPRLPGCRPSYAWICLAMASLSCRASSLRRNASGKDALSVWPLPSCSGRGTRDSRVLVPASWWDVHVHSASLPLVLGSSFTCPCTLISLSARSPLASKLRLAFFL